MRSSYLMRLSVLLSLGIISLWGCSDENTEKNTLLRPVSTMELLGNKIVLKWKPVPKASLYVIELHRFVPDGTELYRSDTTELSSWTSQGLDWDEQYKVQVKSLDNNNESAYWDAGQVKIVYPSKLGETKVIDNSAKITWLPGGTTITSFKLVKEDETPVAIIPEVDYDSGEIVIKGLEPSTSYTVYAYGGNEQTTDTYAGRTSITTQPAEDYDQEYGVGKWLDLRDINDPDYFNGNTFWENLEDGMAIILPGETSFHLGERKAMEKSITFLTGLTLGENAKFLIRNAFSISEDVSYVSFKNIDFYGVVDDNYTVRPLEEETSKSFSAKQVFNLNNTGKRVEHLSFTNCSFYSFRAIARTQKAIDGIKNVVLKGCTINGSGDQGVITTSNTASLIESVVIEDCTFSNVVLLSDIRQTAGAIIFSISDCTFCYAPMEGNNPLFRIGSNTSCTLQLSNTILGASLSSKNTISPNTPGTSATRMADITSFPAAITNTWKGVFSIDGSYEFSGISNTGLDEKALFRDPEQGDFKVIGQFGGANSSGAFKWR